MAKVRTPRPAPTQPERPMQGNRKQHATPWSFWIVWSIFIIFVLGMAFFGLDQSSERVRVKRFVQTICLVEGYPEYEVIKDDRNHWRGFCINAIESVEIPMHPDLNLAD